MIWVTKIHFLVAFGATLTLMLFHYLSPWFANNLPDKGKTFVSFAGGTAVAYVFLHMLPDLVEYNEPIGKFLIKSDWLTPFSELMIYIVALCGFLLYYGLEIMAERSGQSTTKKWLVFQLHIAMFCLYNFLITYTMSLRAQESIIATALFTFSMALHFVLTDRKFSRLYTKQFNHIYRTVLILSLLVGCLCSILFDPVNVVIAAFMLAFLAGSVLLNVFREELPSAGVMSFFWFTFGAAIITITLLLQAWSQSHLPLTHS